MLEMDKLEQKITGFIEKHGLINKGSTVMVGVSGGPDSLALLHYFHTIRAAWNLKVIALSVDHQLRGEESKEDLHYVKKICEQWDITFIGESVDVPHYKKERQIGTQLAARELRYACFKEQMEKHHAQYLALGHHGDDQVETLIMRLVRTANASAFSGIPAKRPFSNGYIVRPMLAVTKDEIIAYCEAHHIQPRIDPSNKETNYTRNYFRKLVVPLLKEKNENIHITAQHLSDTLMEDEAFLQEEAKKVVDRVVKYNEKDRKASLFIDEFTTHSSALQRRAFHLILNYLYHELPEKLSYVHDDYFFSLLKNKQSHVQIDFPNKLIIEKSYQVINIYFQHPLPASSYYEKLEIPGELSLPNGTILTATYKEGYENEDNTSYMLAVDEVQLPLYARTRQSGDRMSWYGLNGSKKLKDIFIDEKIPMHQRESWPIIVDESNTILWLVGLRKKEQSFRGEGTRYIQLKVQNNHRRD